MLENNSRGLERAEIERVAENQYSRLLRQQQDSKASKGTTTADRGEKNRRPATDSRVTASTAKGRVTALRATEARRRRSKNQEIPPLTKRAEVKASATSMGMRITLRMDTVACVEAWIIGLTVVRNEELRRVQRWPK